MTMLGPKRRRVRRWFFASLVAAYLLLFMLGGCADSFLLHPSTGTIDTPGAEARQIAVPSRKDVQAFCRPTLFGPSPEAYLLVFDGNGGRAERAVFWADDVFCGHAVEAWSMNYPGFGGSAGSATLDGIAPAALATYDAMQAEAGDRPIVIWGASLGTTAALYVAANRPVGGVILTNPPPLRQLIVGRYGWWNLWLLAYPVSHGVPIELDSVANAAAVQCPAVIVSANNDLLVPPKYHQKVIDALPGEKRVVRLPKAGHDGSAAAANPTDWYAGLDWLWGQVLTKTPRTRRRQRPIVVVQ